MDAPPKLSFKEWLRFLGPRLGDKKFGKKFLAEYENLYTLESGDSEFAPSERGEEMDYETFQLWRPVAKAIREKLERADRILKAPYPEKRTFGDTFKKMHAHAVSRLESGWAAVLYKIYSHKLWKFLLARYPVLDTFPEFDRTITLLMETTSDPAIIEFAQARLDEIIQASQDPKVSKFYEQWVDVWMPSLLIPYIGSYWFIETLVEHGVSRLAASYGATRLFKNEEPQASAAFKIFSCLAKPETLDGTLKEMFPEPTISEILVEAFRGRCTAFNKVTMPGPHKDDRSFAWVYIGYYQYLLEQGKIKPEEITQTQAWELVRNCPYERDVSHRFHPPDRVSYVFN